MLNILLEHNFLKAQNFQEQFKYLSRVFLNTHIKIIMIFLIGRLFSTVYFSFPLRIILL